MTTLFFYGTLRHLPILEIVLGKPLDQIALRRAMLPEHAALSVENGLFPALIRDEDAACEGVVATGLTDADLERLDYYEGGFEYDLKTVTLEDGTNAQVYFPTKKQWQTDGLWNLGQWKQDWAEMTCHAAREIMGYFGTLDREKVLKRFGPIRTRAWAKVLADSAKHGAGMFQGKVVVQNHRRAYSNFFALDEFQLTHERFDGSMTPPLERSVFVPVDAALVLPYDPVRDRVLLIEQIRVGPLVRGDAALWQLEPIAGRIDPGETPIEAAKREGLEEADIEMGAMHTVAELYPSPGNSTEFFHVFVGIADLPDGIEGVAGKETEAENIRSHLMSFDDLMHLSDTQQIANASLLMAAYWLARHRSRLRSA